MHIFLVNKNHKQSTIHDALYICQKAAAYACFAMAEKCAAFTPSCTIKMHSTFIVCICRGLLRKSFATLPSPPPGSSKLFLLWKK